MNLLKEITSGITPVLLREKFIFISAKAILAVTFAFLLSYTHTGIYAQVNTADDKAFQLLDAAIGKAMETGNVSISFEGIAFGQAQPQSIFKLPVYQVVRGGYLYIDGDKFEMQLGGMKNLSDGKTVVVVDEISKTMYVDSVRPSALLDTLGKPDINKLLDETIGDGKLTYLGEEMLNGKKCHKVRNDVTGTDSKHVLYWINSQTGKLYLMAEWQNNAYDVYWFGNVGKAPKGHDYSVHLPNKELENFYGYMVIDNRFISNEYKPQSKN